DRRDHRRRGEDARARRLATKDSLGAFVAPNRYPPPVWSLEMRAILIAVLLTTATIPLNAGAQAAPVKPRARDLGLATQIGGTPGAFDAITDVAGVEVGHTTLISGNGALVVGQGPVRTGVTVVHPRGKADPDPVMGAWFTLNGNG